MALRGSDSGVHFLVTVVREISGGWACFYLRNNEECVPIQTQLCSCSRSSISPPTHPPTHPLLPQTLSLSLHGNVKACDGPSFLILFFFFFIQLYTEQNKIAERVCVVAPRSECGRKSCGKWRAPGLPRTRQVRILTEELCC